MYQQCEALKSNVIRGQGHKVFQHCGTLSEEVTEMLSTNVSRRPYLLAIFPASSSVLSTSFAVFIIFS